MSPGGVQSREDESGGVAETDGSRRDQSVSSRQRHPLVSRFEDLDKKLLAWLLDNLRAGRAAVFSKAPSGLMLRVSLGADESFSDETLELIEQVAGTSRAVTLDHLVCIPVFGSQREVAGVLLLDEPFDGEFFTDHEWNFCRRCARWLEVARMGRASQDLPRISDVRAPTESPPEPSKKRLEPEEKVFQEQLARPEVFFRALFTMTNAGLPLHESLYFLGESADDDGSRKVATELADGISSGRRLSVVMRDFPNAFTPYQLGLIRIGENTGSLALVLKITAEHLEKSRGLSQKIRSALTYPMVLISGTLLLLTIAPSWLLQGQLEMLKSSEVELPLLTRGLLGWSDFCQSPLFLLLVVGVVVLAVTLGRNERWRKKVVVFSHSVPGLGKIVRTAGAARFSRALGISMKAGVSLLDAVSLSARSTGDPVLEQTMKKVRERLMEGETLAECFEGARVLPDGFAQVMAAGEQSGKVVSLLELMADLYEMEVEAAISSLTVMLEPVLLLFIGIFTAIVLMATLQPTILVLQTL